MGTCQTVYPDSAGLTATKARVVNRIKEQSPVRSTAIQEAEKKSAIDEINNTSSGAQRQQRMSLFLRNYLSDEDYLKASIEKHTARLDSALLFIDSLLHQPAATLDKTAIAGRVKDLLEK